VIFGESFKDSKVIQPPMFQFFDRHGAVEKKYVSGEIHPAKPPLAESFLDSVSTE
jgi:hypothetical protein